MCGIAGILSPNAGELGSIAGDMVRRIAYRGPDDCGVWCDEAAGVALGHARLSILDLSAAGHQPMVSRSGRYAITYNGEIYNCPELRVDLGRSGHGFRGHSDTEVLLAAIESWGIETALTRLNGMFAFAVWDRLERALTLARDRLGEKPLYYGWAGGALIFGSELKALYGCPWFNGDIDRGALSLLLRHNCIPAPYSIYREIAKLSPASYLTIRGDHVTAGQFPRPLTYWSQQQCAGRKSDLITSEAEAVEQLDTLLRDAVGLRMAADVPLGAFLSGGIDSSTVVALMQAQSRCPVRTFSVGFPEADYDEAAYAQAVARHLGTDHTELYVTAADALAVIPRLPALYDEPFADSSQIPTVLLSRLARRHVTVALSGDGGDELFGGYNRYFWGKALQRRIGWLPDSIRPFMVRFIRSLSPSMWRRGLRACALSGQRVKEAVDKLYKLADMLDARDLDDLYLGFVSHWKQPDAVVIDGKEPRTVLTDRSAWPVLNDFTMRMMYLDAMTYLPDDLLVKVDRASMAVGLEARIPLLDHRLVEFAWRLPMSLKIRRANEGKWILRRLLTRYVPAPLFDRPKMGFGVPLDAWLRGPLREWAEALLNEDRLRREGYFHPGPIRRKLVEHIEGRANWHYHLWDVLMFQAWLEAEATARVRPSYKVP
ncbi:MAG: asparagine synthase (glutamine-hydrolyzing) [Nitrospiraceae bacterium]